MTDPVRVQKSDVLVMPKRRRLVHAMVPGENGEDVLQIQYGRKEIEFDTDRLIPFGMGLVEHASFVAEDATRWTRPGEPPHEWSEVEELLSALVSEDVLRVQRAADAPAPAAPPLRRTTEAATAIAARTWSERDGNLESLGREIYGCPIPRSRAETLLPGHRIAHPALDSDGRQLGENNVTPRSLFLDLKTEWKTCPYPGSRFQDEAPMNVTALRLMVRDWERILDLTATFRAAVAARVPLGSPPRVVDLWLLASCITNVPAFTLMRTDDPVANGEVPSALAALFRIADGVRFSAEAMIEDDKPPLREQATVTADAFHAYVEQQALLIGGRQGVCAAPPNQVQQFLDVLIDGAAREGAATTSLPALVGDVDRALAYAVDFRVWLCGEIYVQWTIDLVLDLAERVLPVARAQGWGWATSLAERAEAARSASRPCRHDVLARALRHHCGEAPLPLVALAQEEPVSGGTVFEGPVGRLLGGASPAAARALSDVLAMSARLELATLASLDAVQRSINATLGREAPPTPTGQDLEALCRVRGAAPRLASWFADALAIGLDSELSRASVRVGTRTVHVPSEWVAHAPSID